MLTYLLCLVSAWRIFTDDILSNRYRAAWWFAIVWKRRKKTISFEDQFERKWRQVTFAAGHYFVQSELKLSWHDESKQKLIIKRKSSFWIPTSGVFKIRGKSCNFITHVASFVSAPFCNSRGTSENCVVSWSRHHQMVTSRMLKTWGFNNTIFSDVHVHVFARVTRSQTPLYFVMLTRAVNGRSVASVFKPWCQRY